LRTRAIPERFCGGDSLYEEALHQVYGPLPLPLCLHPLAQNDHIRRGNTYGRGMF